MSKKLLMSNKMRVTDNAYSYFVFRIEDVERFGTIKLVGEGSEDTPTDWGDKTADSETSHTYNSPGVYMVKTKLRINDTEGNGDDLTKKQLIKCLHIDNTVSDMGYFFYNCTSLFEVDLSRPRVMANKIYSMFFGCSALTELDISSLDTTNVGHMGFVFRDCKSLRYLDLSNFVFDNARTISYMFEGCSSLIELNLSSFRTSPKWAGVSISGMFSGCSSLKEIVGELDLSTAGYSDKMFSGCKSLETLYLNNIRSRSGKSYKRSDVDLGDTKVKDECLIYIINELPDLASYYGTPPINGWAEFILPKINTLTREQVQLAVNKGYYVKNVIFNWGE